MSRVSGKSRQPEMFARSKSPTIPIEENHRLVVMTDETDWTELEGVVEKIRLSKLKSAAGQPPNLRVNIGALMLKATRDTTWRDLEDQVRHYAPARYMCGLTETTWSPSHQALHDFATLLGEDGVRAINEYAVKWAVKEELADPTVMVADTTAQEATIPHPNEMGLLSAFLTSVALASEKTGGLLKRFAREAKEQMADGKKKVREYRLFAKSKVKNAKKKILAKMTTLVEGINAKFGKALKASKEQKSQLTKYAKVARQKAEELHATMTKLVPQIRYWLKTGFVASGKIVSLHMSELYSIVRGKVGKTVEFGLSWGFSRLRGGYLLATLAKNRQDVHDQKFAIGAVEKHIALFGKPPKAYAYDRGGYSESNVTKLRKLGVKKVGLAPRGQAEWAVDAKTREQLYKERALVEGGIGTVKSRRYGFNRPRARSARMMGTYGQMSVLGANLNRLARELGKRRDLVVEV